MNKNNIEGGVRNQKGGSSESGLEQAKDTLSGTAKSLTNEASRTYSQAKDAVVQGSERVSGVVQEAYSSAKDAAAPIADKVAGAVQSTYDQARDAANTGAEVATRQIRENPLSSTLTLAATCFFVGWILGRK